MKTVGILVRLKKFNPMFLHHWVLGVPVVIDGEDCLSHCCHIYETLGQGGKISRMFCTDNTISEGNFIISEADYDLRREVSEDEALWKEYSGIIKTHEIEKSGLVLSPTHKLQPEGRA